jgi:hypothetical protein
VQPRELEDMLLLLSLFDDFPRPIQEEVAVEMLWAVPRASLRKVTYRGLTPPLNWIEFDGTSISPIGPAVPAAVAPALGIANPWGIVPIEGSSGQIRAEMGAPDWTPALLSGQSTLTYRGGRQPHPRG